MAAPSTLAPAGTPTTAAAAPSFASILQRTLQGDPSWSVDPVPAPATTKASSGGLGQGLSLLWATPAPSYESATTTAAAAGGPAAGRPQATLDVAQYWGDRSTVTYDVGAGLIHLVFQCLRFGVKATTAVTKFIVSNPITRPIAWIWLEAIKQIASFMLGASRGLVEVVVDLIQPQIA
ncbi:hypothetical protein H9P43_005781 [Blastocladiella emersonii ATCC 22665]|nr:hypothetical protein H9P43_005781 [Blastocladiella emersonii ATCC 22665]